MSGDFAAPGGSGSTGGADGTAGASGSGGSRADAAAGTAATPGTPGSPAGDGWVAPAGADPHAAGAASGPATTLRRSGPGMQIAAWVAIAAGVALLIGISWSVALDAQGQGLEPADVDATGDLHAMQVVSGMCLESMGADGSITEATVVGCDEPHRGEVISQKLYGEARFPGDAALADEAVEFCEPRLEGVGPEGSTWVAWVPTEDSWHRGDATSLCILVLPRDATERYGPDRGGSTDAPREDEDGQEA